MRVLCRDFISAALVIFALPMAAFAREPGVSFKMISKGPPALEAAVRPYRDCITSWMNDNRGSYEDIVKKIDFRNGPVECTEQRRISAQAGFSVLNRKLDEARRRDLVRQELLSIDISVFSGLVWMSQSHPENL